MASLSTPPHEQKSVFQRKEVLKLWSLSAWFHGRKRTASNKNISVPALPIIKDFIIVRIVRKDQVFALFICSV